jgi:DNA-3-methyladenine glycosylase II
VAELTHTVAREIRGPWSLTTSREFWEGFTPAALVDQDASSALSTTFLVEADWSRAEVSVCQRGSNASISVRGDGDLDQAAEQTARFLALDVDARGWVDVARRDPVIADAQRELPGLRPCGFHSPYEAAAWAVLSQRVRIVQAARLRDGIVYRHGDRGAFPTPQRLLSMDLELPGRKGEYLQAVAEAALEGRLDCLALRSMDPDDAVRAVQEVKGLGAFAAQLVVLRGANAPDGLPTHERRLNAEIIERYGPGRTLDEVSAGWRPFRTWASVHLRALRERRTHEIGDQSER